MSFFRRTVFFALLTNSQLGQAQQQVNLSDGQSVSVLCLSGATPETSLNGQFATVSCHQGSSGSGIFSVELFESNNCSGTSRWGVRNRASCSSSSRPDFYTSSARVTGENGRVACLTFNRVEEDYACFQAFDNFNPNNETVEMFASSDCSGGPRWTVFSPNSCSDSSRPDFYCGSIRVTSPRGASICLNAGRVEEDVCCRMGFSGI